MNPIGAVFANHLVAVAKHVNRPRLVPSRRSIEAAEDSVKSVAVATDTVSMPRIVVAPATASNWGNDGTTAHT